MADIAEKLPPGGVFQLRDLSRNAPFQQPGQFETAVDSAMIFAAKLGFINATGAGSALGMAAATELAGGIVSAAAVELKSRVRQPGLRIDQTKLTPSWEGVEIKAAKPQVGFGGWASSKSGRPPLCVYVRDGKAPRTAMKYGNTK